MDVPAGLWRVDGYCSFISNYSDLALIAFGLSPNQGTGAIAVTSPVIVGRANTVDNTQPVYPTISQYVGRTYGSEMLNSGVAETCVSEVVTGPVTYYMNYGLLDDTNSDTFVGTELTISPLLSATRLN